MLVILESINLHIFQDIKWPKVEYFVEKIRIFLTAMLDREPRYLPNGSLAMNFSVSFGSLTPYLLTANTRKLYSDASTENTNKTGSQVGAISKAQKYSKNNYWKHLEKLFFSKKNWKFFFRKKYFFRKSHNAEKLKKRPFRLIKRFYKPKTSKKCKGLPFDRIRKFSKKSRIVPKKKRKKSNERKPLVSHLLLEA